MHAKLEARDIRLEYFQPRTNARLLALDGVDLKVMDGEFVSIVGPSGCGKTTFLSVVDGLIPASAGRILVDGRVVTKPGPDRAVVFQDASLRSEERRVGKGWSSGRRLDERREGV